MTPGPPSDRVRRLAVELGEALLARAWHVTTVESCTGGGVAQAITSVAGSSEWFDMGFVTYANRAKQALVGVTRESLEQEGAVSETVVRQMADGARKRAGADLAVAISGIAGPGGGTPDKPVGTVWFAWADAESTETRCLQFDGDRDSIREQAVYRALAGLLDKVTV